MEEKLSIAINHEMKAKNISIEDKVGKFFLLYENKKPTTTKKDKVRIDS